GTGSVARELLPTGPTRACGEVVEKMARPAEVAGFLLRIRERRDRSRRAFPVEKLGRPRGRSPCCAFFISLSFRMPGSGPGSLAFSTLVGDSARDPPQKR